MGTEYKEISLLNSAENLEMKKKERKQYATNALKCWS